ncbi:carboxypeptidase-like regulatory domain-containing protein [Streptomyces sp. DR7-3]|uniref:carboxypeptidase-like regulatory domain-containing protein n=1 Tax=Streptomyces malaysiensis TaxID=92644 RepID=UPI0020433D51|nr:carboxypeptidase-like regulatory domain-containing protein [Streptomyces sp. DR7-3]MCM3809672.1 carboxypeptidase-like regulatory domain-containing protein [Streptomyces sp. DR7-3]
MSRFIPLERSTLYSPAWLIPYDDFARRVRAAGVSVQLDRYDDGEWLPLDDMAVRTPGAAFAYPGLGRCAEPWAARPRRHRARFAADGFQPLYPADGRPFSAALVGVEFLVHPYDDAHPPTVVTEPRLVRLLPSVSFRYPPGLRTVHGAVVDAATGAPIPNALVEAGGHTSRDLTPWHERTLSDPAGAFRLALRWEGEKADEHAVEETFHLQATERPGRSGSLVVRLPQDTERRHVIEIRES